ncbi:CPBP family intramembrane glutamic endopeptidase [Granulicella sp. S156]|uniref:CPBP family intramembrane glutamic endopeptidase n=1 Tax=Granulicella sp. S156 TaxID=1747224 RepID=UPI00131AB190|nr:CPBP family intramembrane glutamic endopeptidase [Granulicella sp. S156]
MTDEVSTTATAERRRLDLMELCVGYVLILLVIWTPRPWQRALYWLPVLWILVVSWLSFDGWKKMGLHTANLLRPLWIVGIALLMAAVAVVISWQLGTLHVPDTPWLFFKTYIGYAIWSFVQQLLLLVFSLQRLLRLLPGKLAAVLATATIFALAHLPNPILTPATLLWGLASCLLFLHYRNLYPLALTHAILGICIATTVPGQVTHNMRVGLGYLRYHPHRYHQRNQVDHMASTPACVIADAPTRRS